MTSSILFLALSLFVGKDGIVVDAPVIEPARPINFVSLEVPRRVIDEYMSRVDLNAYRIQKDSIPERTLVSMDCGFSAPYKRQVFSPYGRRNGRFHKGVDIPLPSQTPITAAFDGVVRISTYLSGYGHIVIIRHPNGLETSYAHLSRRSVKSGDKVEAGQVIAFSGSSGRSTGPHLHFEMLYCGHSFNPELVIDFKNGTLRADCFILRREHLK